MLEVRIPKPEQARPRRVSIQIGDQPKTIDAADRGTAESGDGRADDGAAGQREPAPAAA